MSDIDVSKIDVGWRVQFDATNFNRECKKLHGVWGTVSSLEEGGLYVTDHIEGCRRYLRKDASNLLAALPPEPAKDPFAVGEWVVCVKSDYPVSVGECMRVTREDWNGMKGWFRGTSKGGQHYTMRKPFFRPATPEEISAHLGTTPTNTILDRAQSIITGNRQTTNGKPERSFHKIAERWSLTLGTTVTAQQVALMMVDLKMVRALEGVTTEGHDDHFVDMAGYVALAAELGE